MFTMEESGRNWGLMFLAYEHSETMQKWGEMNNRGKAELAGYDGSFGITRFTKSEIFTCHESLWQKQDRWLQIHFE